MGKVGLKKEEVNGIILDLANAVRRNGCSRSDTKEQKN